MKDNDHWVFIAYYLFSLLLLAATGYVVFFKAAHGAWFILSVAIVVISTPSIKRK